MKYKNRKPFLTEVVGLVLTSLLLIACSERTNQTKLEYIDPEPAISLIGTYSMGLTINDISPETLMYRPYLKNYVGDWKLKLEETGRFSVINSNFIFEGLFSLTSDDTTLYGTTWLNNCFYAQNANEVSYRWRFSGNYLSLVSIKDDCFERSLVLTTHSWLLDSRPTEITQPLSYQK